MLFTSEKINPQIFKNIIFCTLQKVRGLCPSVLVNQDGNVQNNLLVKNLTVKVMQITVQHIYTQHSRSHWTATEIMTRIETYGMYRESVMTDEQTWSEQRPVIWLIYCRPNISPKSSFSGLIPIDTCRELKSIQQKSQNLFYKCSFLY